MVTEEGAASYQTEVLLENCDTFFALRKAFKNASLAHSIIVSSRYPTKTTHALTACTMQFSFPRRQTLSAHTCCYVWLGEEQRTSSARRNVSLTDSISMMVFGFSPNVQEALPGKGFWVRGCPPYAICRDFVLSRSAEVCVYAS